MMSERDLRALWAKQSLMADDKTKKRPQDSTRVNVNELDYWCEHFRVSRDKLKER